MRATTRTQRRIEAFINFCIEYQIEVSIILWLLIIIGAITLWRII